MRPAPATSSPVVGPVVGTDCGRSAPSVGPLAEVASSVRRPSTPFGTAALEGGRPASTTGSRWTGADAPSEARSEAATMANTRGTAPGCRGGRGRRPGSARVAPRSRSRSTPLEGPRRATSAAHAIPPPRESRPSSRRGDTGARRKATRKTRSAAGADAEAGNPVARASAAPAATADAARGRDSTRASRRARPRALASSWRNVSAGSTDPNLPAGSTRVDGPLPAVPGERKRAGGSQTPARPPAPRRRRWPPFRIPAPRP